MRLGEGVMTGILTVDAQAGASYIRLSDGQVARTTGIDPLVSVDFDAHGRVVGVEFLVPVATD